MNEPKASTCPRCKVPLKMGRKGTASVMKCAKCHGIWVMKSSLPKVFPDIALESLQKREKAFLTCPMCSEAMSQGHFDNAPGVTVDACLSCEGLWLDAFEANRLESSAVLKRPTRKAAHGSRRSPRARFRGRKKKDTGSDPKPRRFDVGEESYDEHSFWRNVPRALAMPLSPMRLILLGVASVIFLFMDGLGCFMPFLALLSLGMYLFMCLKALRHGANGVRKIFDLDDYQGLTSILWPLLQMFGAVFIIAGPAVFMAESGGLFLVALAWVAISSPIALILVALSDGFFSVINPLRWIAVLKARPGQFLLVALVFNGLNSLASGVQAFMAELPAGPFLGAWTGMVVSVGACHMLGVWVYCNHSRLSG